MKTIDNAKLISEIRQLQREVHIMEDNYKLGLYSDIWYNAHVKGIQDVISAKQKLYSIMNTK